MSSCETDSEDDLRFRSICDPTFTTNYGKFTPHENSTNSKLLDGNVNKNVFGSDNNPNGYKTLEDARESFILARKICQKMQWRQREKSGLVNISDQEPHTSQMNSMSLRRKGNRIFSSNDNSSLLPYLNRQLEKLLDERVDFTSPHSGTVTQSYNLKNDLYLVKHRTLKSLKKTESFKHLRISRKTSDISSSRHSEQVLAQRCQNVALSPEWILGKKDVSLWPHPKNLRYVDSYKIKERKADGSILVVPYEDMPTNTNVKHKSKIEEKEYEVKHFDDILRHQCINMKDISVSRKELNSKKQNISGIALPNFSNDKIKKRKQTRKRSGKKAKRIKIKQIVDSFGTKNEKNLENLDL